MSKNVLTVTQINTYIKAVLDENVHLNNVMVIGEISNFLHYYRSGHMYFTLKDDNSQLKAVMFSSYASRLKFKAEDGLKVICRGRISSYEKDGVYQLYVEDMQPDGFGALAVAYEQLKNKLQSEGLFDSERKKPIPSFSHKIGVATSDMGAAIEDIKNITARRFPLAQLVIAPTSVQGEQAAGDIVKSLQILDSIDDIDLIIVGRGGGSIEDLWAFNTEAVARAVYNCKKPVISAVGHETDYTICDFVADLRAPTPSAAAELAVADGYALIENIKNSVGHMYRAVNSRLEYEIQRFDSLYYDGLLSNPQLYFDKKSDEIINITDRLQRAFEYKAEKSESDYLNLCAKLDALNPVKILARGYLTAVKGNAAVKSVKSLEQGDKINLNFYDGSAVCTVDEVKTNE